MPGPSRIAEFLVALIVPPARREEILGDLHERYTSPLHYFFDTLRITPFVIFSQIRRTSDAQTVLLEATTIYASYLGGALLANSHTDPAILAVAAAISLIAMHLADLYWKPYSLAIGFLAAFASMNRWLPWNVLLMGSALGFIFCSGVRLLFAPAPGQLRGIHVPASWLKSENREPFNTKHVAGIAICLGVAIVVKFLFGR